MKQTLYHHGVILTMDASHPASAILVKDGRIAALGTKESLLSMADSRTAVELIDLDGACLMPAFLDAHSHFSGYAMSLLQVPLEEAASFQDIRERIQAHIARNQIPAGTWIVAKGYDHNHLAEKKHPPLSLLDQAAPHHPLIVQHQSGHMGVCNSLALEQLHITPETPAPAGGRIGLRDGRLTGYLEENAFILYSQKVPVPSLQDMLQAFQTAQKRYASYGITTLQEGMFVPGLLPFYEQLLQADRLWLDLVAYADAAHFDTLRQALPWNTTSYHKHLKLGGMKIFLDGSPQGRTAWMRDPYLDSPDDRGYPTLTDEQVQSYVHLAAEQNVQLLAHCNGDAAVGQYLDAWKKERARQKHLPHAALFPQSLRPVIVHAQLVGQDQLEEARDLGLLPSFFVAHVYYWGDIHLQNFGHPRASHISPAAAAKRLGLPFTFHQDAPVIEPNMLETVWCAVCRRTRNGVSLAEEAISVPDALQAVTANAAYQYFEETVKGTLSPGKLADFVILSQNPLSLPPDQLKEIKVLATFKEGNCVYRA